MSENQTLFDEKLIEWIGSKLIEPVLVRASADRTACYLETGIERNIHFYEKHGFNLIDQGREPKQGLSVWVM